MVRNGPACPRQLAALEGLENRSGIHLSEVDQSSPLNGKGHPYLAARWSNLHRDRKVLQEF